MALVFALVATVFVIAVGGGVDISREVSLRTELADAVDAAAIGSVSGGASAVTAAGTMSGDGVIDVGAQDARRIFDANLPAPSPLSVNAFTAVVSKTGLNVAADVTATGSVPSLFLGVIGIPTLTTTAHSAASANLPAYVDYYLLLDNTPSMGIGATPADVTKMVNNTPDQCGFACHDLSNPNNYYNLAKTLGVTTRIDVMRQATQQLFATAGATEVVSNQFRMGLYTFGTTATAPGFTPLFAPSNDLDAGKTAAAAIDLMTVPYQGYNNDQITDYKNAFQGANTVITTPGDGSSSAKPQKVLFFVSDGVNDSDLNGGRVISTIDPALCQTLKDRGIKIAVLYTTYLPLPTNGFYNTYVAPMNDQTNVATDPDSTQIAQAMRNCASSGLYFQVTPTQGISQAMNALFQKTVLQARITH